jgi:NADPH:quinone reductase-like Zn-dependent oxidoreductase
MGFYLLAQDGDIVVQGPEEIKMSRIVQFTRYGAPEVLEFKDIQVPLPADNEVRIKVRAIGLNRAESMWRKGEYVEEVKLPARLGYEVAGTVEAVGAAVTHVGVGDVVSTVPAFSQNDYGMYGELVLAPAHAVVKHPASLSFEEAVAIWNPFITPWGAFAESGLVKPGDAVLISAASSSVGLGAIQMANALGAVSIALTRTSAKRAELLAAGAQHVIATDEQDVAAETLEITGGRGADVVFESVGGAYLAKLVAAMAPGATMLIYGALSEQPGQLPMLDMIAKQIVVRGYNLFGVTTTPERLAKAVKFISDGLASGVLRPHIQRSFGFDEIVEAHRYLEKSQHLGRIVVIV